jgi:hypothetical protein
MNVISDFLRTVVLVTTEYITAHFSVLCLMVVCIAKMLIGVSDRAAMDLLMYLHAIYLVLAVATLYMLGLTPRQKNNITVLD